MILQVYSPFEAECFVPGRMAPEPVGSVGFIKSSDHARCRVSMGDGGHRQLGFFFDRALQCLH
jgi:hypothetical protein